MNKNIIEIKKKLNTEKKVKEKKSSTYSNIRLLLFLLFVIELIVYISTHSIIHLTISLIGLILFIIMVILHHNLDNEIGKINNCLSLIKKYERRNNDEWKSEDYIHNETNLNFVGDLDIIGKNSLFQFLNFTSSLGGRKKLIKTLSLEEVDFKKVEDNQSAIGELKENFNFVLSFQEQMNSIENIENIDFKELFSLFDKKLGNKKSHLIISLIITTITILSLVLSILKLITPAIFIILFFTQLAISYIYSIHFNENFEDIEKCSRIFSKLNNVYDFINNSNFQAKKNLKLKKDIIEGKNILKDLTSISELNLFRTNFLTNILLNVFASLNFILLYRYSNLLSGSTSKFKRSIESLEEFEVLISLTTICFVRKDVCLPTVDDNLRLEIKDMKHPLIEEDKCISNSFSCKNDINIITGSNMSGKTSFMRTIGINLILAYSGTYVSAKQFSCSIMKMFTSINVKDDIANGISTFYGELKRIKDILDYTEKHNDPIIVFIDEIFKGTNYNDRILGAKEVLKQLAKLNAIVFLTTHDFELCEIKSKTIHNYHFEEKYTDNKISFDYKIKDGQCKTTNAKYLMQEMGIIK